MVVDPFVEVVAHAEAARSRQIDARAARGFGVGRHRVLEVAMVRPGHPWLIGEIRFADKRSQSSSA